MADPTALQIAVAAAQAVELVGLPEARINLAQAVIHIALAPKSNAVVMAIGALRPTLRQGGSGQSPRTCAMPTTRCQAPRPRGGLRIPDDVPEGIVAQQYAPDAVAGRAY